MSTVPQTAPAPQAPTALPGALVAAGARTSMMQAAQHAARCVAEATWDQVASGTLPATSHTQRWHDAVRAAGLVVANHPDFVPEAARFRAALELARDKAVTLGAEETATVTSGTKTYTVDPAQGCPCPDAQQRSKYCKHVLATMITTHAFAQLTPAPTPSSTLNGKARMMDTDTPTLPPHVVAADPYAPSTLCLKARVGDVEMSWTLRGEDEGVAERAKRVLAYVERLAQAKAPQAPAATPPPQTPPLVQTPAAPACPVHGARRVVRSKKFSGWYCQEVLTKTADGTTQYCQWQHRES